MKKMLACFFAAAMLIGSVSALAAPSIGSAKAETGISGVTVQKSEDGSSVEVTYPGKAGSEYVVMAVTQEGIDTSAKRPTKETIGTNDKGVVVYMNQVPAGADGTVKFSVKPKLDGTKKGDTIGIFISGTDTEMVKVGEMTVEELQDTQDVLYGDLNGDKRVNNKDLTCLIRYLNKWPEYQKGGEKAIDESAADVHDDGKGKVNNKDLTALIRCLNKWPAYQNLPYKPAE